LQQGCPLGQHTVPAVVRQTWPLLQQMLVPVIRVMQVCPLGQPQVAVGPEPQTWAFVQQEPLMQVCPLGQPQVAVGPEPQT
jgi:hypothetical protein